MIRMSVIFFSRHAFCNTFSTHDLSWRSTKNTTAFCSCMYFSTHDLSWRSTTYAAQNAAIASFSTPDLSWRSTLMFSEKKPPVIFQLTTSRGGRPAQTGRIDTLETFQLTTSRGGRHGVEDEGLPFNFFNSRPLVEVDIHRLLQFFGFDFSTHDLSWRSTQGRYKDRFGNVFNSRPLVEVDYDELCWK